MRWGEACGWVDVIIACMTGAAIPGGLGDVDVAVKSWLARWVRAESGIVSVGPA